MSFQVETSRVEPDIVVLHLSGSMTLGPEIDALQSKIHNLTSLGDKKLIFELSGIEKIDSAGGVALVRCFFAAREAGGVLHLANPSLSVQRLFRSIRVESVISLYPDLAAACENFPTG